MAAGVKRRVAPPVVLTVLSVLVAVMAPAAVAEQPAAASVAQLPPPPLTAGPGETAEATLAADPLLGPSVRTRPGLRIPGAWDSFEACVRAILGQQVSVKAATTLASRFVSAFGEPFRTPFDQLTHLSPTVERVARRAASTGSSPR